jgi:hypothetical protein
VHRRARCPAGSPANHPARRHIRPVLRRGRRRGRSCTRNGSWPRKHDPARNRRFSFGLSLGDSVPLSMPLGLIVGRPFRRAISSRCSPTSFSRAATLPDSSTGRGLKAGRLNPDRDGGGGISVKNLPESSRGKKNASVPHSCPSYFVTYFFTRLPCRGFRPPS